MEMLWHYAMTENMTNQNAGYSMWGFAKKDGKDYFVKQFLSPKYPANDTESSPERLRRKQEKCEQFVAHKKKIYERVNTCSDGNDVRICEFFRVETKYYLSMEKITALPLDIGAIAALDITEKRRLCAIIAHSIAALHRGGVVHADLKHENILFMRTKNGTLTAKIIDFDSAFLEAEPPGEEEEIVGDWVYFSPEAWERINGVQTELTCKIDVFALGILFHQYFAGELPQFDHDACSAAGQALQQGYALQLSDMLPADIAGLLETMLARDPEARPSAQEVFRHFRATLAETGAEDVAVAYEEPVTEELSVPEPEPEPEAPPLAGPFYRPGNL